MIRRPPRSSRTDTLFPYTTLFRSDNDVDSCGLTIEGISHEFYKAFANRSIHVDAQCLKHPTLYFQGESGGSRDVRRIGIWGLIMHHACLAQVMTLAKEDRSEERRVGKECVSTWRSRGARFH